MQTVRVTRWELNNIFLGYVSVGEMTIETYRRCGVATSKENVSKEGISASTIAELLSLSFFFVVLSSFLFPFPAVLTVSRWPLIVQTRNGASEQVWNHGHNTSTLRTHREVSARSG